jgi:biotin operon repressor
LIRLTSPQTYKVVAYLLAHPKTSQIEISTRAGVSRNLVNHVISELEAPGVVTQRAKGHLELSDSLRLLDVLSTERPLSRLVESEVRTEESEVPKVERMIRKSAANEGGYTLTAFSALARYLEYYITYPTVHVYSQEPLELTGRIPNGRGDVTVQILTPDSELILKNARRIQGFALVEPVQVVIDLFCLGGSGRDGATKLYEEIRKKIERSS